jgi:hypothetical protein
MVQGSMAGQQTQRNGVEIGRGAEWDWIGDGVGWRMMEWG